MDPFAQAQVCKKRKEPEVITLDDEEPAPTPSPEVLELREKLAKAEDMCQRAFRSAGEAEVRAKFAEDLLESKRDALELSARMGNDVNAYNSVLLSENVQCRNQLYEAENSVEVANNAKNELLRENVQLRSQAIELENSVEVAIKAKDALLSENVHYRSQLYQAEISVEVASKAKEELTRENTALLLEIQRLQNIAAQFEEERNAFTRERMGDRSRIAQLVLKLSKLEKAAEEQKNKPQRSAIPVKSRAATATISSTTSSEESMDVSLNGSPDLATRENTALLLENQRLMDMSAKFEEERNAFTMERVRNLSRISDMGNKLSKMARAVEVQKQQLITPQRSALSVKSPAATATISPLSTTSSEESMDVSLPVSPYSPDKVDNASVNVHDANDPINLFRLCPSNEPWIAPADVNAQLRAFFVFGMVEKWQLHCANSKESYACGLCDEVVRKVDVFDHFFAKCHRILVHSRRENVSQTALHYWKDQLQLASGVCVADRLMPGATAGVDLPTSLIAGGHWVLPTAAAAPTAAATTPTAAATTPTAAAARPTAVAGMAEDVNSDANSSISVEI